METTFSKETEPGGSLVFFDLDRTLADTVSGTELAKRAIKKGYMKLTDVLHALFLLAGHKLGFGDPHRAVYGMAGWVKGVPEQDLQDLCSEVLSEKVLPALFPEAREEIKKHKLENSKTIILSSSLAPICRGTAAFLGIDDVICSELEVSNGLLTGRPVGNLCFGEEKLVRLRDYCKMHGILLSAAWYYADSITDLPALKMVGHPVCVNPDRKLEKEARTNGWRIFYWKKMTPETRISTD